MADFRLQIMASDHSVYDGQARSVTVPTTEGMVGIMAHHSSLIMAVIPGTVEFVDAAGERHPVVVADGLLKVENNEVMILVDAAEDPDQIDADRAMLAAEKAREELRKQRSRQEYVALSAELSRALSRLNATNKHTPKM